MKKINSLTLLPESADMISGIDIIGNIKKLFNSPIQAPGCLILFCIKGQCSITIHLTKYHLKENSIAIIFPNQYIHFEEKENQNSRFIFLGFSKRILKNPILFSNTIQYLPVFLGKQVIELKEDTATFFYDYFKTLIKANHINGLIQEQQIHLIFPLLLMLIRNSCNEAHTEQTLHYSRNQEIAKELTRIIIENYQSERNISFYAEKMHLSPQHLSTTIKKTTGKTITDIISSFVIHDAKAKLRSTELTIQEIAYSLNFPDISFFGKYFKRYTGMSPKQYRQLKDVH